MRQSKFTEQRIIAILRELEAGSKGRRRLSQILYNAMLKDLNSKKW